MAGSWIRVGGVLLAMSLMAGCGADREVEDVESVLVESYLEPLEAAGITASVESACRYAGPVDALWHLRVRLRLDASSRRVADVLRDEDMVVQDGGESLMVQQIRGAPRDGWNGGLKSSGGSSELDLTFNNVSFSDWKGAVGWAEVCPNQR